MIRRAELLASTGFELQKEGARRVFLVTDAGVSETGLVERGGGVGRRRPRGRSGLGDVSGLVDDRGGTAGQQARPGRTRSRRGGIEMDTAKVADAVFTHGGNAREQEGFLLMPRGDEGMGRPLISPPRVHTHHGGHGKARPRWRR